MNKFSVIIPTYNAAQYLPDTIDSVLKQTYKNYEIIVVNDGSTDDSLIVLEQYKNYITLVTQKNLGVSSARNHGARVATGNVLAFLDADDIWLPNKLLFQNSKLEQGYGIVYTNRSNFGSVGDLPEIQTDICVMNEGDIWEDLLLSNVITTSSLVVEKDIFNEFSGFNELMSYCEDWELWLKFAEKYPVGFNEEPLVKYRVHFNGLSKNYKLMSQMRQQVILIALGGGRGKEIPIKKRRRIIATTYSCSAWEAAVCKDFFQSFRLYIKALVTWPFGFSTWYDFARLVTGKI